MPNSNRKSWKLDRRSFIRGAGVSLALPALDCMAGSAAADAEPKRLAAIYFPFGVALPPKEDSPERKWYWFPKGEGRDFKFNESLKVLEPHRENLTVLGGLSHPKVRKIGGHDSGDTFLTGWDIRQDALSNVQSMDQVAAAHFADQTRFSSLVMSTDGGVGEPTRSSTLSYNEHGRPIPALNQPRQIFDRFFGVGDADTQRDRRRLSSAGSMLDLLLDDAKTIRGNLGKHDQDKLDEYLDSVRQVEQGVERSQAWVDIPKPDLSDADREMLKLDSDDQVPTEFVQTMYDLIYLAFRTDSTRVATYQIASMGDGSSKAVKFPQLLGLKGGIHKLAHGWNKPAGAEELGKWDRFLATQFSRFLDRMSSAPAAPESDATLLDRTTIIYGSSNSTTHNNQNYPLILAGGRDLGFKHGQFLKYDDSTPFANVFTTMLGRVGVPNSQFGDSTGILSEVVA
ncbi:MAG: hypothetical protein ACI8UO_004273 [Verrucomicrobiales bacterium]|jgi:hypothetical protein